MFFNFGNWYGLFPWFEYLTVEFYQTHQITFFLNIEWPSSRRLRTTDFGEVNVLPRWLTNGVKKREENVM